MNKQITDIIISKTHSSKILKTKMIQELWAGYGEISRIYLDEVTIILKLIDFSKQHNHPRGWNSETSHARKVQSYKVEMNWYQNYNKKIKKSCSPSYIASGDVDGVQYLLLEDLQTKSFEPRSEITWEEVKQCLSWLAAFHSGYLHSSPEGIWNTGTYWHLETRADELETMQDKELKKRASSIDKKLNSAKFKTFVHGDAKLANFLFNDSSVAAVDFQYVGGGVGVKDLAYFLSSIYQTEELFSNEKQCLDYYFNELNNSEVEREWRELYPYAWTDFYRFLNGWSPNHPKINCYSQSMRKKVLACL